VCAKDINQSFTSICIKEMPLLPLIKSQVIGVKQMPEKQILVRSSSPWAGWVVSKVQA
jgi:hypothetical protein